MTTLLVIGLDGASFELLDRLAADGTMPVLAGLLTGGVRTPLRSTIPPITPTAWTSFMTGKRPGKHGIYDFRVYDPHMARDVFVSSRAVRDSTIWQLFTRAGRRVGVVGLPMMYPPPAESGTVVSGFDTPSTTSLFTYPAALRQWILEAMPDYSFVAMPASDALASPQDAETFLTALERGIDQRTEIALHLLDEQPFDVFMLHHQEPDVLQHKAWPLLLGPRSEPGLGDRLRSVYRHLDTRLGDVIRRVGDDAQVIVLSDHGFGTHVGRLFPNVLLRNWGYLRGPSRWRKRLARSVSKRLAHLGLAQSPMSPTTTTGKWETRVREVGFDRALPLDWTRTRAYVATAEIYGLLYVNLRGREPHGIVSPGAERNALCAELRERLLAVRDPVDHQPLFQDVLAGEAVDTDDRHGRRPDLILLPRGGFTVYRDLNDRLWLDHYRATAGTHRPEGVLIARGPGIRRNVTLPPVDLVDMAPTLLASAGIPLPDDMDGRPILELFEAPPAVTYVAADPTTAASEATLSTEDEQVLTDRLRALGYMT